MTTLAFQIGFTALLTAMASMIVGLFINLGFIQKIVQYVALACIVTAAVTLIPSMLAIIWQV